MRALILILAALTLGGCTASLSPVSPGVLASPPAALTAPCAAPEPVGARLPRVMCCGCGRSTGGRWWRVASGLER